MLFPAPAGPSIAIVLGVIVALVAVPRVASPPALSAATVVAAPQHAPRVLLWALLFAVAYRNVPRVLPRLGVLAVPTAAASLLAHSRPAQLSGAQLGRGAPPAEGPLATALAASRAAPRLLRFPLPAATAS